MNMLNSMHEGLASSAPFFKWCCVVTTIVPCFLRLPGVLKTKNLSNMALIGIFINFMVSITTILHACHYPEQVPNAFFGLHTLRAALLTFYVLYASRYSTKDREHPCLTLAGMVTYLGFLYMARFTEGPESTNTIYRSFEVIGLLTGSVFPCIDLMDLSRGKHSIEWRGYSLGLAGTVAWLLFDLAMAVDVFVVVDLIGLTVCFITFACHMNAENKKQNQHHSFKHD